MITVDAKPPTVMSKVRELLDRLGHEMSTSRRHVDEMLRTNGLWLLHPEQMSNLENEGIRISQIIERQIESDRADMLKQSPPLMIAGAPAETNLDMPPHTMFLILNRKIVGQISNLPCPGFRPK